MPLTREDVEHLAELSRLALSEDEAASMQHDLESVLGFVGQIQGVDTTGVEPMSMPARAQGWRADEATACDDATRELILSNFPSRKGDLLATPGVFEKPKGGKN